MIKQNPIGEILSIDAQLIPRVRHNVNRVSFAVGQVRTCTSDEGQIPVHFERDLSQRNPSCKRSVVFRPLVLQEFVTGLPTILKTNFATIGLI